MKHLIEVAAVLGCALLFGQQAVADESSRGSQSFAAFDRCQLASGQSIAPCRIGYRTFGKLNADKSNAVLVPTWFTGTSQEHESLVAPELLDPAQFFIVIVDAIGNGVSISPSNSATQADESFPVITIADMVDSQHKLLTETLGVTQLHGVMGLSMGGMQAFEWAVRYPDFAQRTVAVIGSPRLATLDIALWASRNRLLGWYRECECTEALETLAGLRMLGSVPTTLSDDVPREKTEEAIVARGGRTTMSVGKSWDQQRQAEAMMTHNIARDLDNDLKLAAEQINTDLLIIVSNDDRVVTPAPAREFARLSVSPLVELDEDCGHGDPWCAQDEFSFAVRTFLAP